MSSNGRVAKRASTKDGQASFRMIRNRITQFKKVAKEKLPSTPDNYKLAMTFFEILKFIHKNRWKGACHATSAIMYILLKEQGIDARLYIGECQRGSSAFDHSWIEIDGEVVDAAISKTWIQGKSFPPVLRNIDLKTGEKTKIVYGVHSGQGYGQLASTIKDLPLHMYMDIFPYHPEGLWGLAKEIGTRIGIKTNLEKMKGRYCLTKWEEHI